MLVTTTRRPRSCEKLVPTEDIVKAFAWMGLNYLWEEKHFPGSCDYQEKFRRD